jgi:hypothetical protein
MNIHTYCCAVTLQTTTADTTPVHLYAGANWWGKCVLCECVELPLDAASMQWKPAICRKLASCLTHTHTHSHTRARACTGYEASVVLAWKYMNFFQEETSYRQCHS